MVLKNYSKLTKNELVELARKKGLEVTSGMRKADIARALESATRPKRAGGPKTAAGKGRPAAAARRTPGTPPAKAAAKKKTSGAAPKKARTVKPAVKTATAKKAAVKAAPKKPAPGSAKGAAPKTATKTAAPKGARKKSAPKPSAVRKAKRRTAPKPPAARERRIAAETIRQRAEAGKYYLGSEERAMPPVEAVDLPAGYGTDRIAAMIRDPHWIFSYWEVTGDSRRKAEKRFGKDRPNCRLIVRVFDRTGEEESFFDIEITPEARNWYINVAPGRRYQLAIGVRGPDGRFEQIAISNVAETPSAGISDVVDDRWMVPREIFERIFTASGGHDMHAASVELRELLERRLLEEISSGAVSSLASAPPPRPEKERGFRLWVSTEVILYGATEPDASVTIRGKEVKLRGDGTFSVRFALPDGSIDIPVTAVSTDRIEERTIETSVRKKSEHKEPVLR